MVKWLLYTWKIVFNVFQSPEISPMQLIFLSEAENLVADLDTGGFLESPTFDIKYLNVPESKFLPLMLQKNIVTYLQSW
jgi:hypothetical protein